MLMIDYASEQARKIDWLLRKNDDSLLAVCRAANLNYKTLAGQISKKREIPASTLDRICHHYDAPPSFFSAYNSEVSIGAQMRSDLVHQRAAAAYRAVVQEERFRLMECGYDFQTDDFLNWISSSQDPISEGSPVVDRVDFFKPVGATDNMMQPLRIGRRSLSTQYFKLEDEAHYLDVVGKFDRTLIDEVLRSHVRASTRSYQVEDVSIDVMIQGRPVRERYRRAIAASPDKSMTLVFSILL